MNPPWRRSRPLHPPVETLGPSGEAPSFDVAVLQEEANKALGHLLVTRSSIDAWWRKQVSDFGIVLHQNELQTTEAIKEAKTLCACTIWDVETYQTVLISDAKVWHTAHIKEIEDNCAHASAEAENCCLSAICDAESQGASNACSIQQSHTKEEGRDHPVFLTTCSAALRANPSEAYGYPIPPTTRKCSYICPTKHTPGVSPPEQEPALQTPPSSAPAVTRPSPQSK